MGTVQSDSTCIIQPLENALSTEFVDPMLNADVMDNTLTNEAIDAMDATLAMLNIVNKPMQLHALNADAKLNTVRKVKGCFMNILTVLGMTCSSDIIVCITIKKIVAFLCFRQVGLYYPSETFKY